MHEQYLVISVSILTARKQKNDIHFLYQCQNYKRYKYKSDEEE